MNQGEDYLCREQLMTGTVQLAPPMISHLVTKTTSVSTTTTCALLFISSLADNTYPLSFLSEAV